ncbi:4'-phosphopantetheinyl transferase family protein [Capnocytophaga canis]|uniref:4'-phosphopantetheinyl transferase family protein n=1 Tax=Capnocytophaga canis TaxID=1848903 RepID=UPI00156233D6|nr:4'-phosphopantetheinyl transferase superfamily protein [Capnocytophaga canis]
MPLFETINVNEKTQLYIWKVSETLEDLTQGVVLSGEHQSKFDSLKVESAKKNFIAVRRILKDLGYSSDDLFYNHEGKPYLRDGKTISISHSFDMVCLIVGEKPVGVDIEKKRRKIIDISEKFTQWDYRSTSFSQKNVLQKLTMIWSAKEAGYKAHGKSGITAEHILVKDFFPNDSETKIKIEKTFYDVSFINVEDYVLAYCL